MYEVVHDYNRCMHVNYVLNPFCLLKKFYIFICNYMILYSTFVNVNVFDTDRSL